MRGEYITMSLKKNIFLIIVVVVFLTIIPLSFATNENNFIHQWNLENVTDTNNTMNWTNNVSTEFTAGQFENAANFSGENRYLISSSTPLTQAQMTGNWTVNLWVYAAKAQTDKTIMNLVTGNPGLSFSMVFNSSGNCAGKIYYTVYDTGYPWWCSGTVQLNEWHMYTTVHSGTTIFQYTDKVNVANYTWSVNQVARCGTGASIGTSNYCANTGGYFNGSVDNMAVYTKSLTQTEIDYLYLSQYPYNPAPPAAPNTFTFFNTTNVNTTYTYNTTPTFTINATNASAWNITLYVNTTTAGTAYNVNSTYIANTTWSAVLSSPLTVGREYQWWFTANSNATNHVNSSINNIFIAGTYPVLGMFVIQPQCSVYTVTDGYYIQ